LTPAATALASAELYPELTLLLLEILKGGFLNSKPLTPTHKVFTPSAKVAKNIENEGK
jgi:hypothetical protein